MSAGVFWHFEAHSLFMLSALYTDQLDNIYRAVTEMHGQKKRPHLLMAGETNLILNIMKDLNINSHVSYINWSMHD